MAKKKETLKLPDRRTNVLAMLVLAGALAIALVIWLLASTVFSSSNGEAPAAQAPTASPSAPSATASSAAPAPANPRAIVPGTEEANRKAVLARAVALLRAGQKEGTKGDSYASRLNSIQEGEGKLADDFKAQFRFSDYFEDEELQAASYIAVIHLARLTQTAADAQNKDEITPLASDAWTNVYVDLEAGQAFVPVTVFLGQEASFSLEYLYIDGEWRMTPYSLLDSIQSAERASSASTPTPSS